MVTFRVPDMTCGHCADSISKAVAAVDAAARVGFDIPAHLVRVTPGSASPAQLEHAIRRAGYAPAEQASPHARTGGCGCGCGTAQTVAVDLPQERVASKGGCCSNFPGVRP